MKLKSEKHQALSLEKKKSGVRINNNLEKVR